eukprot:UN10168
MAVTEAIPHISDELQKELQKSMEKGLIRYCDMNSELSNEAVDVIISAIDKHQTNFEVVQNECSKQIKETMDKRFGATWHCIIGENYGFEVTHEQENLLYLFYQGNIAVLLFKC